MSKRDLGLILLSAALQAVAFPPWDQTWAAWIALVPFLHVVTSLEPRRAAWAGLLFGTVGMWAVAYWVPVALSVYWGQPLWFGVLFSLGASIVFAGSYSAGFAACAAWATRRTLGVARVGLLACLWVAWDFLRAHLLTGDPWLLLGYTLAPSPRLAQLADLGGVYTLAFLVLFVNASFLEAARTRGGSAVRVLATAAALVIVSSVYGSIRLSSPLADGPTTELAIIQGNNPIGSKWSSAFYGEGLERYLRLSARASRDGDPAVLIWPESAVTFFLAHEPAYLRSITRLLEATKTELIVGSPHYEPSPDGGEPDFYNSAFYLDQTGKVAQRYDKAHLLPFAEYFPLRTIEILRRQFERVRTFTPGDGTTLLETPHGRVAVAICFEAIYPEIIREQMNRGAELLVNLSNDAWLGAGPGPAQHLSMVVLRAIENRTWVVRSTTTGVSAVIDPHGTVRAATTPDAEEILAATVVASSGSSPYRRLGDAFAYLCLALSLGSAVWLSRAPTRRA